MKEMIHKYEQNGQYIVLDVCSGGVHVVDELTYKLLDYVAPPFADVCPDEIIAKMDGFDKDDVKECYQELKELYDAKMLFTEDDYEQYAAMAMKAPIKAMCLHVSHDCNLRCKYCFAQTGDFGGDRMLMKPETGKRAMDFLIKHSANRENLEVDFFGGEPLMAWDTVVETVKYARSIEKQHGKNFRFTMTTNGMLIDDDVIDFCNKECHNVVLSLDGRKEVHDRFRKDYAGHGSYDAIVPKFQEFVKKRGDKNYYMRGTYTHYNTDFTNDIFHMADLANVQAGSLPYGAQRRLEIMRALATSPKLLLLDEPAAGMNPSETAELTETIRRIRDEFNIAVLLIEHDMSLVMGICEGIAVLNFGRIIAKGTPDEIRNNPQVIEAYLGKKEG